LFCYEVNDDVRLYIYSYGIGVFVVIENGVEYSVGDYASRYCENRKLVHKSYLIDSTEDECKNIENEYIKLLHSLANGCRNALSDKKRQLQAAEISSKTQLEVI